MPGFARSFTEIGVIEFEHFEDTAEEFEAYDLNDGDFEESADDMETAAAEVASN